MDVASSSLQGKHLASNLGRWKVLEKHSVNRRLFLLVFLVLNSSWFISVPLSLPL